MVRLDFSGADFTRPESLHRNAMAQLGTLERRACVVGEHDGASERFAHLIQTLRERSGHPVAVLVDEYDKPILDALEKPAVARANPRLPARPVRNRQILRRRHPLHAADGGEQVL